QSNWPVMRDLLGTPGLAPSPEDIEAAYAHFREVLAIRKSTPLFRLPTGEEIKDRLRFYNTGPGQIPGLIVLSVEDADGGIDRAHKLLVVALNASDETAGFTVAELGGRNLVLHPRQIASSDPVVRTASVSPSGAFSIPARTAAVFWAFRPAMEQIWLLIQDVDALEAAGVVNGGQANALRAKLQAALQQAERGNDHAAANQLGAFLHQVRALLTEGEAEALIANAGLAIEELER
ncbi:DUF3372 domain-containing protein, partial [bacterium]